MNLKYDLIKYGVRARFFRKLRGTRQNDHHFGLLLTQ